MCETVIMSYNNILLNKLKKREKKLIQFIVSLLYVQEKWVKPQSCLIIIRKERNILFNNALNKLKKREKRLIQFIVSLLYVQIKWVKP